MKIRVCLYKKYKNKFKRIINKCDKILFRDFIDQKVNQAQEGKDELQATGQDNKVADTANSTD